MTTIDQKTAAENYDQISCLESRDERMNFLDKQSPEMKVALWLENIDRKTQGMELSAEQKEIIEIIKEKFVTAEFAEFAKGKSGEEEAGPEYIEIMTRASQLLGRETLSELFGILGDSSTLKNC